MMMVSVTSPDADCQFVILHLPAGETAGSVMYTVVELRGGD